MRARRVNALRLRQTALALLLTALAAACSERPPADPANAEQVALGKRVYDTHCAACHGANLEGQPKWRERLPNGRLPAPPHDETGHTWHHADRVLFGITKHGLGPYAPPGYESDMPAYGGILGDDEIWAVLAYIKSTWPEEMRGIQAEVTRKDR